mmetsp:Transcript_10908/g.26896  ORF Transcript_10908/g.26896 Transcript_10908/m.26896 type:complete len:218 (-) Transcript_10908:1249-1902(-)
MGDDSICGGLRTSFEPLCTSFENISDREDAISSTILTVPSAAPAAAKATRSVADPANRSESATCSIASPISRTLVPATLRLRIFPLSAPFSMDELTFLLLFSPPRPPPLFSMASPRLPTAHPDTLTAPPANRAAPPVAAAAVSPENRTASAMIPNAVDATRNDSERRRAPSRSASVRIVQCSSLDCSFVPEVPAPGLSSGEAWCGWDRLRGRSSFLD